MSHTKLLTPACVVMGTGNYFVKQGKPVKK
jgi:hypothetical protein